MDINGLLCHDNVTKSMQPKLSYNDQQDFLTWKTEVKNKLIELLGLDVIAENACSLQMEIVEEQQKDGYKQIRFEFESEKGAVVPCYLLIPDTKKEKSRIMIDAVFCFIVIFLLRIANKKTPVKPIKGTSSSIYLNTAEIFSSGL